VNAGLPRSHAQYGWRDFGNEVEARDGIKPRAILNRTETKRLSDDVRYRRQFVRNRPICVRLPRMTDNM
jgi:hypothetical protein